jgi:predicted nucleic acid-binding protein
MLYFDTSFIVPYILPEATSNRVQSFFSEHHADALAVSDWTRVEFFSMLAREVRGGGLPEQAAREADLRFEAALAQSFLVVLPDRNDFDLCKRYLGRFETGLRGGDAMHLAVAANHGAQMIYTLDKKLLRAGKMLGLPIASGIHGRT